MYLDECGEGPVTCSPVPRFGLATNYVDAKGMSCKYSFMIIGSRLRKLREERHFSQGDIEKRTGLLRCYVSRVENGHTVPSLETLERLASALELPLYMLFYEGDEPPAFPKLSKRQSAEKLALAEPPAAAVMPSPDSTARTAMVESYVRASPITPTLETGRSTANDCHSRL